MLLPGSVTALDRLSAAAATLAIGIGGMALAGWLLDNDLLKGAGGSILMKANAAMGLMTCETLTLSDEQVGKFMDDALARRGNAPDPSPKHYEAQLRVIGKYFDDPWFGTRSRATAR